MMFSLLSTIKRINWMLLRVNPLLSLARTAGRSGRGKGQGADRFLPAPLRKGDRTGLCGRRGCRGCFGHLLSRHRAAGKGVTSVAHSLLRRAELVPELFSFSSFHLLSLDSHS